MIRYADSARCPACGRVLPVAPERCPGCGVMLRGERAQTLFDTLTRADALVAELWAARRDPSSVAQPAHGQADAAPSAYPVAPIGPRRGLRLPTVPVILLTLGALALLAASVIFLAFAWSWLGVGGRTAVLLLLTAAAAAGGAWMLGRGLRVAGESFLAIALGLVLLDLLGARQASWLGRPSTPWFVSVAAVALSVVGIGLCLWIGRVRLGRPYLPQYVASFAALAVPVGLVSAGPLWRTAVWVPIALALGGLLIRVSLRIVAVGYGVSAFVYWIPLVGEGIHRGLTTGYASYVAHLGGWPLLAAALLVVLPSAGLRRHRLTVAGLVAVGATLVTLFAILPALHRSAGAYAVAALAALVVWTVGAVVVPRAWWPAVALPGLFSTALALAGVVLGVVDAGRRWHQSIELPRAWAYRLTGEATSPPVLMLLTVLALAAAVLLVVRRFRTVPAIGFVGAMGVAVLAVAVTLAAYRIPVVAAVVLVLLDAAAFAWWGRRSRTADATGIAALALGLLCYLPAEPARTLVVVVSAVVAVGAAWLQLRSRSDPVRRLAGVVLPVVITVGTIHVEDLIGVDVRWQAVPVLVLLGLLAVVRPRPEVEVAAAALAATAVWLAFHDQARISTPLAVVLTVAGVAVTATALIHTTRRWYAPAGGLLLAAATWVRLADLGVDEPEAYTLPSAVVLVVLGLLWLRRESAARTPAALGAGLSLATFPSLIWLFGPASATSWRALLLGGACLALVLAGARLRWSAPLVVGAVVGAVLVLLEIGPYAAQVPPWALIALGGALLVGLGITWESRMRDVREGYSYLVRLR